MNVWVERGGVGQLKFHKSPTKINAACCTWEGIPLQRYMYSYKYINIRYKHLMGGREDKEARLLSVMSSDRARSNGQEAPEISTYREETLFCGKGYWAQVTPRSCGVSILGDI